MTTLKLILHEGAIKISNFLHLRKLQGPHDSMNTPGENKNRACKLGSENTSWIRKYHKYDKMDRKIRNCDIFSIECKNLDGNT